MSSEEAPTVVAARGDRRRIPRTSGIPPQPDGHNADARLAATRRNHPCRGPRPVVRSRRDHPADGGRVARLIPDRGDPSLCAASATRAACAPLSRPDRLRHRGRRDRQRARHRPPRRTCAHRALGGSRPTGRRGSPGDAGAGDPAGPAAELLKRPARHPHPVPRSHARGRWHDHRRRPARPRLDRHLHPPRPADRSAARRPPTRPPRRRAVR